MNLLRSAIKSLQKTFRSFRFAIRGIGFVIQYENNTRIHLLASLAAIIAGMLLKLNYIEWTIIITQIVLVWSAEAFNSAIEKIVDFISPDFHPKAGAIKDIAAGAVLFIAIGAAITGLIIFGHKIWILVA
ncbi:diacylglycerol kinase family protein [Cytophagaceae bacterium DM2B3-1]|uniref:Diacylglycerol kinase family protein n=1 Tax=Xanthocytophaga flava TaxID=3048013 RepID=A0ABT7CFI1_9BACT|nr:diacylglycerol kinase family protein [Xanthocytophaga flavus]MDJ1466502.1 diacylglycerol kinase family protein [Xanthocytophaga flavus]MDJ1492499.1 diacylglycerol kinase family protein [Xanthocytophaga flavus]